MHRATRLMCHTAAMRCRCHTCACWHGRWPASHWSSEGHWRSGGWPWCAFPCYFPTANKSHRRVRRAELEEASPRVTFKTKEAWSMAEADTEAPQRGAKVWECLTPRKKKNKNSQTFVCTFCTLACHQGSWREGQQHWKTSFFVDAHLLPDLLYAGVCDICWLQCCRMSPAVTLGWVVQYLLYRTTDGILTA